MYIYLRAWKKIWVYVCISIYICLKLKTTQNELANAYLKEQTEYIQNQIDKIRDSVEERQSRIAWQTINEVSTRKRTAKTKLKATSQEEWIQLWKQHFENLLGNPPKVTHEPVRRIIRRQLVIKLGLFTQEELDLVLRKFKNWKAAGLDEIPTEAWKTSQFDDILLRQCNVVHNQNPIDRSTKGCIHSFPKWWPRISQERPRYNPNSHGSQDIQCSTTQPHRIQNWDNIYEEPKLHPEK